ncbi:two-component sensor histidine kinase, partial [Streptosporangium algeriense]
MRRDALWAVVALVMGLILLAAGAYNRQPLSASLAGLVPFLPATVPVPLLAVPLLLTCLGVVVRRSHPVSSLALGTTGMTLDLIFGYSLGTIVVFTDNLYSAALYGPARLGRWMFGTISTLAILIGCVIAILSHDLRVFAVAAAQFGLLGTAPVVSALIVRQFRTQAELERARAEQ